MQRRLLTPDTHKPTCCMYCMRWQEQNAALQLRLTGLQRALRNSDSIAKTANEKVGKVALGRDAVLKPAYYYWLTVCQRLGSYVL